MADDDDSSLSLDALFPEPPRPPSPEPTVALYTRDQLPDDPASDSGTQPWSTIEIRLVGTHSLWGHHLWNASRAFASYLDARPELYKDRAVLELGAGGGLPGIVTALNGARTVVLTDYPDAPLLDNLTRNVRKNIPSDASERVFVEGYLWGKPVGRLLDLQRGRADGDAEGFDLIIMSDLVFNHSQHDALLNTCDQTLSRRHDPSSPTPTPTPTLLVFFTHHRPHLAHRDMQFLTKARERGWTCEEILTQRFPPMFPQDPGDEQVRATVHGWQLTRSPA